MENKKETQLSCVDCHAYHCHHQNSRYPEFCLTSNIDPDTYKRAMDKLMSPEDNRIAVAAAQVEYEGYVCRYTTDGALVDTKKSARNRNGYYRVMRAEAGDALNVKIEIFKHKSRL